MKIQKEHTGNLVRIDEMEGGEVFINNEGTPCLRLSIFSEDSEYNAINLYSGILLRYEEYEEFHLACYDFIIK